MKRKGITERELLAYTLRQEGRTYKSVGEEMNISVNAARELCVRYERKARYNAVVSDYKNGKSIDWIAENSGYSNSLIISLLIGEKVITHNDIKNFVLSDYTKGDNIIMIAKRYAVDVSRIENLLHKEELKKAIVSDYLNGVKVYRLKQKYMLTAGEINDILKESGSL